ncbi:MAG: N-acetylmuramoyl-L-alanine amidase [Campylobacter sp.]|uniref:N-acetylmuramoyl-L-alanine amidase n=1 Tax=Campylobacter sp. TaxID=205 RepID=UPI001B25513D|nr:N-acetylmuramoyl-L-alanine amidase [Campylobacter sp.]MBO5062891.1 N-acetylmuramoyl-L-alanine amidase [Campylobacter sp.]MBO5062920.1 N-acetylmuramoyl-L-alanine amidase [Campylobacter sp.]
MQVNKLITRVNFTPATNRKIKYIVVHYVGATGGAEANCMYFLNWDRGASAHYFVGHVGEVWQCVEDKDIAWHCGAKKYVHADCRNSNSIGVEMCVRKDAKGNWYFEPQTVASTIDLVKELMSKYDIPVENVIRHFDVTGKMCPQPYVKDENAWRVFKNALVGGVVVKENTTVVKPTVKSVEVIAKEVIKGSWGNGSERKERLTKAGYNYTEVQDKVNELLGAKKQAAPPKSVDAIAREVIKGLWGNGADRKTRLEANGYNYREVQNRVNALLK